MGWRKGGKAQKALLGSCMKISEQAAMKKARAMKTEALGYRRSKAISS
jgi:hypothetical protein